MAQGLTAWRIGSHPRRTEPGDAPERRAQLAALVRSRRERRGLSQRELADAVAVSQSLVSLIESPTRPLNVGRSRLLDVLRSGLGMTPAEIDACCWLAGRAPLSEGEARQLFGASPRPPGDPETTARAMLAAARAGAAGRLADPRAARGGWWPTALGGLGVLLVGIAIGLAVGARTRDAQATPARATAAQELDLWGWVSYRQRGAAGAQTFDIAAGSTAPLVPTAELVDLAACPSSRARIGLAERTATGLAVRVVDDVGRIRWTASRLAAQVPGLSWTEGCTALVFRTPEEELLALGVENGVERPLARLEPGTQAAVLAPRANVLAWIGADDLLRVRSAGEPDQVVGAADVSAATPAWASDGQRLAWLGPQEEGRRPLSVYTLRTGQWRRLGQLDGSAHTLAWAPSGQGIAFAVREGGQDRVLIRAFSGDTQPLFEVVGSPLASLTWSCGHTPHAPAAERP